ncbi:MAG: hypothetical protein IIX86_03980, partial [Clostridia bacterium]|nr:hypothetical protein [Clostridia bacterium]
RGCGGRGSHTDAPSPLYANKNSRNLLKIEQIPANITLFPQPRCRDFCFEVILLRSDIFAASKSDIKTSS